MAEQRYINSKNLGFMQGRLVNSPHGLIQCFPAKSWKSEFRIASENELKDIIGYTEDPIVSSDAIGSGNTMVFDTKATMIASNKLLKTIAWFDNGWGFANRILELAEAYTSIGELE